MAMIDDRPAICDQEPADAEALFKETGFRAEATWTDPRGWFAVCLGRAS